MSEKSIIIIGGGPAGMFQLIKGCSGRGTGNPDLRKISWWNLHQIGLYSYKYCYNRLNLIDTIKRPRLLGCQQSSSSILPR